MAQKALKRNEVPQQETWDLSRLYKTEADYEAAISEAEKLTNAFVENYKGKLGSSAIINKALDDYRNLQVTLNYIGTFQSLNLSSDQTNEENAIRSGKYGIFASDVNKKLVFFLSELQALDPSLLEAAKNDATENKIYLEKLIKDLEHKLDPIVEKALSEFSQVLNAPRETYQKSKLSDMNFGTFKAAGETHDLSFSLFEGGWSNVINTEIRRAAFENFYAKLGEYENGLANNYQTQILKEKAYANLKGFNTVFDYLLDMQDVSLDLYNRQIDIIMEKLAPAMRKYAGLLKEIHGLDKMTYADLHLAVDPEFEPTVTAAESKNYALESLALLGPEYRKMIERSYDERWIDFPKSLGKSTGGFCASPYRKGSYILLNWNNQMNEVFVLAHELGHAGHFYFCSAAQNAFNTRPSMYFVEAPSTMNEIIMAEHLKAKENDERFKRWVLSSMVSRTYYHNCVTHLLEANYQREVYRLVEAKKPITAKVLNDLMLGTIKKFWGDAVEVPDYAGRTWMRQPHYFMGLYPYTYSAGLTVATAAFENIRSGKIKVETWLDVLKAGGTLKPVELAKMAEVDLTTEQPLLSMINYVSSMIDEVIDITKRLK